MIMFWKWAAQGAQIGTVAFFILIVFALLCGAVLALVGLLSYAVGGKGEKASRRY